jgi:hypothetical protein
VAIAQVAETEPDLLVVRSFGGSYRNLLRGPYRIPLPWASWARPRVVARSCS